MIFAYVNRGRHAFRRRFHPAGFGIRRPRRAEWSPARRVSIIDAPPTLNAPRRPWSPAVTPKQSRGLPVAPAIATESPRIAASRFLQAVYPPTRRACQQVSPAARHARAGCSSEPSRSIGNPAPHETAARITRHRTRAGAGASGRATNDRTESGAAPPHPRHGAHPAPHAAFPTPRRAARSTPNSQFATRSERKTQTRGRPHLR